MSRFLLIIHIMSCCAGARAVTIGQAKKLADGEPVSLSNVIPTAGWFGGPGTIKAYVQEQNRSAGIALYIPETLTEGGGPGLLVNLSGTMDTVDGEKCINVTECEWLPGPGWPKPLGIPSFGNWQGLNPGGLLIRSWGVVTESPDHTGGAYPNWFKFSDGSGDIKAIDVDAYWGPVLLPMGGEPVTVSGIASPVEKTIHFTQPFEVWMLGTINFSTGSVEGHAHIYWESNPPTQVYVSGPGIDGWQPGWWEGQKWVYVWSMPDPLPAMPAEYRFRFVRSGYTSQYKGWITGYVNGYPTDLSPADGAHITGTDPVTFSWTPPAGGPFSAEVHLWELSPTPRDLGIFEAGSNTSFTYPGVLEPGQYRWRVGLFRSDDNGCMSFATFYYDYAPPPF